MHKGLYLFTYLNDEGEEEVLEVPAYSREQAEFLSGLDEVLSVEETVRKGTVEN